MPRPLILAGLLGAAVGAPYAMDQAGDWPTGWPGQTAPATNGEKGAIAGQPFAIVRPEISSPEGPGSHLYRSLAPIEGIPTYSLAEVLRMDVTKEWIYRRWARKSTGLAEPELFGVRVPLVSGTRMTDVAGSLTYYFNVAGQIDRITLTGQTADTSELVNLLIRQYGFEPQTPQLAGEQLFQVKHKGRVASELRTRPQSVLWATSPHSSFSLELEINRPGSDRFVERPLPKLEGIAQPKPPDTLFGAKPPPGKPIFPVEQVVPTSEGRLSAEQASVRVAPEDEKNRRLRRVAPPVLRWPY